MAEYSYFWDGISTGHAALAPYNAEQFQSVIQLLATQFKEYSGVISGGPQLYCDVYRVDSSTVEVTSGVAIVSGVMHYFAGKTFNIARPSSGYFYYTIFSRVSKTAQEARLVLSQASTFQYPTPTQTDTLYEIPVAYIACRYDGLTNDSVTLSTYRIHSTTVGLIPLIMRVGGSATDWHTAGSTQYTLGSREIHILCGSRNVTITSGYGNVSVTFPSAPYFVYPPLVFMTAVKTGVFIQRSSSATCMTVPSSVTTSGFVAHLRWLDGYTSGSLVLNWLAIGEV